MPDLEYTDQVLSSLITDEMEEVAMAEVDAIATFPAPWHDRLVILRGYILACLEYASANDDPFTLKLGQYQAQYDAVLADARAALTKAAMSTGLFAVALERA